MISVLNERAYAEDMLENGKFLDKKRGQALYILAKYSRFKLNLSKSDTKKKLIEFCDKAIGNYYTSDMYINVNKAISMAFSDKSFFVEVDNIVINKSEVEYIQNINIKNEEKRLLFIILCIVRMTQLTETRDEHKYWTSNDPKFRFIRRVGNFDNKFNVYESLHYLNNEGLIRISSYKNTIEALFMGNIINNNGEVMLVNDYDNIGYWWDKYILGDKNIIQCACCQSLIKRKSNRQVLCKECSTDLVREYKSAWYQERRKVFLKRK